MGLGRIGLTRKLDENHHSLCTSPKCLFLEVDLGGRVTLFLFAYTLFVSVRQII